MGAPKRRAQPPLRQALARALARAVSPTSRAKTWAYFKKKIGRHRPSKGKEGRKDERASRRRASAPPLKGQSTWLNRV